MLRVARYLPTACLLRYLEGQERLRGPEVPMLYGMCYGMHCLEGQERLPDPDVSRALGRRLTAQEAKLEEVGAELEAVTHLRHRYGTGCSAASRYTPTAQGRNAASRYTPTA